ncbi:murein hydrolase activator EnvC family protein [Helicobacter burdigaliensis]|uniref:murein hydrolase activator EnvC family protein n=1 Tax=Helicobacter burdigaliensis TaxID=2315334 RepID=UPI000EF64A2A|nr:peptidoglycan DD-metalloendopeptidase family protein [Helicobacter burdigaliensis]
MQKFLFSFLLFLSILQAENIKQQIDKNQNALIDKNKQVARINQKLEELGNALNLKEKELQTLNLKIKESETSITKNEKEFSLKEKDMVSLSKQQEELFSQRKKIEREIIDLVIKDISFIILLNDFQVESLQDLITEESFKVLNQSTKDDLAKLSNAQSKVVTKIASLQKEIDIIRNFIDLENKKRLELKELQNKQETALKDYQKEIQKYDNELKTIIKERDSLQEILVQLNILKSQEEEKKRKQAELAKQKPISKDKTPSKDSDIDVRQVASSYHKISTTKYQGAKTIAPLDDFTIEKRFGTYYDPVYKMKVFNESITLAPKGDDKVKSVLDGKVVFAKDTPLLKRVVIIEHKNNMHTIYAQLDKIAPTIKPGSTVKKGYTIGRTQNALKFEVTLKDKHIDPLELISIKN